MATGLLVTMDEGEMDACPVTITFCSRGGGAVIAGAGVYDAADLVIGVVEDCTERFSEGEASATGMTWV